MICRCYGEMLALLAALTCGLGVADVALTMAVYCQAENYDANYCSNTQEPYVWVWVSSGIWASVPIFLTGLYGICVGTDAARWRSYSLMLFLSSIVFSPAIIVLTAIELHTGHTALWTFYSFSGGSLSEGTITAANPNPYQAKFGIPLAILILGGIMFFMTGYLTMLLCCCMQNMGISLQSNVINTQVMRTAPEVVTKEVVYQSEPRLTSTFTVPNQCDPCRSSMVSLTNPPTRYNNVPVYGYGSGFTNFHSGPGPVFFK